MRKKYVKPNVILVKNILCTSILAGSPGDGSSDLNGQRDPIDVDGPSETGAKQNQFTCWENWDDEEEY